MFSLLVFQEILNTAYDNVLIEIPDYPYSKEEVIAIFKYFFLSYFDKYGNNDHLPVSRKKIEKYLKLLPAIDVSGEHYEIVPESYEALIDSYFERDFQYYEHSLMHFFAGDIRKYIYLEVFC